MRTGYFITIISLLAAGCTAVSKQARASMLLNTVWEENYLSLTQLPMNLKVRYNPSACDKDLVYEASIYGYFPHVYIVGSKSDFAQLEHKRSLYQPYFVHSFLLTDTVYMSACGQQHYVLKIQEEP